MILSDEWGHLLAARNRAVVIKRLLESLSNSAGDSYENVTLKGKSRCFKLYRAYSISFNLLNVGNFPLQLNSKRLYQSSGKKKESRCLVFTYSIKREIWHFYVVVLQWLQRNVQKKRDARAELLFCQSWNLLLFCRSRWRRRRRCLSSLTSKHFHSLIILVILLNFCFDYVLIFLRGCWSFLELTWPNFENESF